MREVTRIVDWKEKGSGDNGGGGDHTGGGNPPGGGDMEKRVEKLESNMAEIQLRLIRVESKLDATATKADLSAFEASIYKAMNDQTWKFIGAAAALASLAFVVAKFAH